MFRVGAPGACVEHVSSSLVSYLCLRPFQANGGGMKLRSEIARTKKKKKKEMLVFFFFFSPYPLSKPIKKTKSFRQKWVKAPELRKGLFVTVTRTQTHFHASAKKQFLNFCKPSVPTKTCQYLFSINTIHINLGGNCLVYVYHIALNKASENENEVKDLNW